MSRLVALWRHLHGQGGTTTAAAATPTVLQNTDEMDYAYRGEPYVVGSVNSADDATLMDLAYRGIPYVVKVA